MTQRGRGLVLPVLLIAAGVIFLLVNTGVLSAELLQRLGDLWPLILVILGLQLIFNHTLPRAQARLAGLLAAVVIVIAAIAYSVLAPAVPTGTDRQETSEAINGVSSATLDLSYSGATVDLQSAALGEQLFKASVDYPSGEQPPDISLDRETGELQISGGGSSSFRLFGARPARHITVTLTSRIPWKVQISGGAADMHLALGSLQLSGLDVSGGASRLDITLPAPRGTLAVNISGGASSVTLHAPSASQWRVSVNGGVSSLSVNGRQSGGIGQLQRSSAGYDGASDRLQVDVSGGVSRVELTTG